MTESCGKVREISLGEDFGAVVVSVNGARIAVGADSHVIVSTRGGVELQLAANDHTKAEGSAPPKPGDRMADGTVYAGISPDKGKAMYATPDDAPGTYTFNQAQEYAEQLDGYGHRDWRVPTKSELNVLFNNRAPIGGSDVSGSNPAGWYWSSSQNGFSYVNAWAQRFFDGSQDYFLKSSASSLRLVR
jgi:hypothetical protein